MIAKCKKCKKDFTWIRACAEDDRAPDLCQLCTVHHNTIKVSLEGVRDSLLRFEDLEHASRIASAIIHLHVMYIKGENDG